MRPKLSTTIATYCILTLAGGVSFVMPDELNVEQHAGLGIVEPRHTPGGRATGVGQAPLGFGPARVQVDAATYHLPEAH